MLLRLTVFFVVRSVTAFSPESSEIDQLIAIVVETEQISNCQNLPLNSRAQISDGSERRSFVVRKKFTQLNQRIMIAQNNRVGLG
jgi:hypothetical protein